MIHRTILAFIVMCSLVCSASAGKKDKIAPLPPQIGQYEFNGSMLPVYDGLKSSASGRVPPSYPAELKKKGISGSGTAIVVVDKDGKILHVGATEFTHPEFAAATIETVKKWKYHPLVDESGAAVVHALSITLRFTLGGG